MFQNWMNSKFDAILQRVLPSPPLTVFCMLGVTVPFKSTVKEEKMWNESISKLQLLNRKTIALIKQWVYGTHVLLLSPLGMLSKDWTTFKKRKGKKRYLHLVLYLWLYQKLWNLETFLSLRKEKNRRGRKSDHIHQKFLIL